MVGCLFPKVVCELLLKIAEVTGIVPKLFRKCSPYGFEYSRPLLEIYIGLTSVKVEF